MANNPDRWYFTKEQLDSTPSRKCGYDKFKELSYRQQTANFIQDMGQKLKVSQLCINTAIVYMHRFYVFHSFTHFPWYQMAAASLFLAAKVEEQPRKLEHVIRVANLCRNNRDANIDITSERYIAQSQDLVFNENVLLQTLGFDVAIDHPHTHVVRCCTLVRASKDLAQSSYFMASNSLHLTTMCLQYKPTVVACFCIHLASKWSKWEIPLSSEQKEWFVYVDPTVTVELIQQLTSEFLTIYEHCPSRLKEKIKSIGDNGVHGGSSQNVLNDQESRKMIDMIESHSRHESKSGEAHKHRSHTSSSSSSGSQQQHHHHQREREYREKKEREKLAQLQQQHPNMKLPHPNPKPGIPTGHNRPMTSSGESTKPKHHQPHPARPSSSSLFPNRTEPRDILREAKDPSFGIATKDYHTTKEVKREAGTKPPTETNIYNTGYNGDKVRVPIKQETVSPLHLTKHPNKQETEVKPPIGLDIYKSTNSAQPKVKQSPFDAPSKSVPKQQQSLLLTSSHHNDVKKEEGFVKKPSLFSPEKSPTKKMELSFPSLSPIMSPPTGVAAKRNRNYSSGSEPELRPVMKKIDQVEGFENLMRDTTIGINKLHQIPDMITPITDKQETISFSKDLKPPDMITPLCPDKPQTTTTTLMNGIETDSKLISSLLKETPTVPHLLAKEQQQEPQQQQQQQLLVRTEEVAVEKEHNHHKRKKHKEKHKHKEKSREDREKKKKHKDKKDRHKSETMTTTTTEFMTTQMTEPIKLKIPKDRIVQQVPAEPLKLIIPKDIIKTDYEKPSDLKIKIPRDKIHAFPPPVATAMTLDHRSQRKRDRNNSPGEAAPPSKSMRNNSVKQNGRHHGNNHHHKVSDQQQFNNNMATTAVGYHNMAAAVYQQQQPGNIFYYAPPPLGAAHLMQQQQQQQFYNYYNGTFVYPTTDMCYNMAAAAAGGGNPPLPMDAPPTIPPPPPPE